MKKITLRSGEQVPAFGMGTWRVGEDSAKRSEEIATIRLGLDLGASLIDTAEMYGDGKSEELVGEAIRGHRDSVFLVSKVYPHNATRQGTQLACERSLRRLGTDQLDLYLLHWRGSVPLPETIMALMALNQSGKIRHYGVSNLDLADLREAESLPGTALATNQLLYNLARRGIEWDVLPWLREKRIPVMAYSPLEQVRLLNNSGLVRFSRRHGMTPAQASIAWLLNQDNVIVIPKSSHRGRLRENLGALDHPLNREQLDELNVLFPPPRGRKPLEML